MLTPLHRERALLYHLPPSSDKGGKVRGVLQALGIAAIDIADADLGQTVGYCAGISGYGRVEATSAGATITDEVLVMVGLSDEKINQLLARLRKSAAGSIGLMAVVTEHNRSWTLARLFAELSSERRLMTAYVSLQQSIKAGESYSGTHSFEKTQELEQALASAKAIVESESPPELEDIRQADERLRRLMKQEA